MSAATRQKIKLLCIYCLDHRFDAGIHFGAKTLIEIAVVLLGVSVSAAAILENRLNLILGIAATDLLTGQWILREPGSGTRSAFMALLQAAELNIHDLQIALTLPSNVAVRSAVMSGRYVTVVSELVVASQLQAGLLKKVDIDLPKRAFSVLRHKERYKTKASLALEQIIDHR